MSKLTNKDFDDYLGNDEFYNIEDEERVIRRIQKPNGMKRHWIPQTLTVALVFGLFIVGVPLLLGDISSTGEDDEQIDSVPENITDWSDWIKAESLEDVDAFYEATIPGLRIAKELNQVIEVNQKYVLYDNVSLYIDDAWYHEDKIHLFYSMDLSGGEVVTNNKETGILHDFILESNGVPVELTVDSPGKWSGVVFDDAFNNKIYRVASITLDDKNLLSGIEQLTASISVDAHNDQVTLDEVELPIFYGSEVITSNKLDEIIQTANSVITFERFDKGADKGYLYGSIQSELGQEIHALSGKLNMSNGDSIYLMDRKTNLYGGKFVITIPELATENLSIQLDALSMIELEKTIDIPVDVSEYQGSSTVEPIKETMNELIAEVGNTGIYLRSILFDNQGVTVGISTEEIDPVNPAYLYFSGLLPEMADFGFPNVLVAEDNNGEEAKEYHFLPAGYDVGSEKIINLGLTENFIKNKEQVVIKIKRLSLWEEFNRTVEIPKQN